MLGHLVAILMGDMAEGKPPLPWPPHPDPDHSDAWAIAALVHHLALPKSDYVTAVALAAHHLRTPKVKAAIVRVADALGRAGELDDRGVRDAVGPELLRWFYRVRKGEELCST
jgi:hypothetical protein